MKAYGYRDGSEVVKTRLVRIQARALALTILVFRSLKPKLKGPWWTRRGLGLGLNPSFYTADHCVVCSG